MFYLCYQVIAEHTFVCVCLLIRVFLDWLIKSNCSGTFYEILQQKRFFFKTRFVLYRCDFWFEMLVVQLWIERVMWKEITLACFLYAIWVFYTSIPLAVSHSAFLLYPKISWIALDKCFVNLLLEKVIWTIKGRSVDLCFGCMKGFGVVGINSLIEDTYLLAREMFRVLLPLITFPHDIPNC